MQIQTDIKQTDWDNQISLMKEQMGDYFKATRQQKIFNLAQNAANRQPSFLSRLLDAFPITSEMVKNFVTPGLKAYQTDTLDTFLTRVAYKQFARIFFIDTYTDLNDETKDNLRNAGFDLAVQGADKSAYDIILGQMFAAVKMFYANLVAEEQRNITDTKLKEQYYEMVACIKQLDINLQELASPPLATNWITPEMIDGEIQSLDNLLNELSGDNLLISDIIKQITDLAEKKELYEKNQLMKVYRYTALRQLQKIDDDLEAIPKTTENQAIQNYLTQKSKARATKYLQSGGDISLLYNPTTPHSGIFRNEADYQQYIFNDVDQNDILRYIKNLSDNHDADARFIDFFIGKLTHDESDKIIQILIKGLQQHSDRIGGIDLDTKKRVYNFNNLRSSSINLGLPGCGFNNSCDPTLYQLSNFYQNKAYNGQSQGEDETVAQKTAVMDLLEILCQDKKSPHARLTEFLIRNATYNRDNRIKLPQRSFLQTIYDLILQYVFSTMSEQKILRQPERYILSSTKKSLFNHLPERKDDVEKDADKQNLLN